jgi:hypothetical protein
MMTNIKYAGACIAVFLVAACATSYVRQVDLDSWKDVPVEALDTHSFFLTVPMVRTVTESGIEIRNYVNSSGTTTSCVGSGTAYGSGQYVNSSAFSSCSSGTSTCNNIFYIKEGRVLEYAPTGNCRTDITVQPEARYMSLTTLPEGQ